jgi:undecaprenyl-diphosphatase
LTRTELPVLLVTLAVVGSVWGFVALADEVVEGDTQRFDDRVIDWLRRVDKPALPRGPDWLREVGRDLTALGGIATLSLITVAVAVYLVFRGKYHAMLFMAVAVVSGVIVSSLLKHSFDRPRPPGGSELTWTFTSSFPSGHSMISAVVYLTLGAMLARTEERRLLKFYFLALAMLLSGLVGLSRVYLLAHYPSDVLGGWTAGLAWASLCWLVTRYLQRRGAVESSAPERNGG